jgi:hypothetical protein
MDIGDGRSRPRLRVSLSAMSKFSRSTPPPERLIQGGNHLLYETQMLFNTAALLDDRERWDDGWAQKTLYMATIESLLVHRRSLMDFYFPPSNYATDKRRESDILAHDFCDGWAPVRSADFQDEWKAISVEIHHMSYLRPEVGSNWQYTRMLSEIKDLTTDFLEGADHRLHGHIKGQLRGILHGSRVSIALTPAVEAGQPIASMLSELFARGATPTTTLIDATLVSFSNA